MNRNVGQASCLPPSATPTHLFSAAFAQSKGARRLRRFRGGPPWVCSECQGRGMVPTLKRPKGRAPAAIGVGTLNKYMPTERNRSCWRARRAGWKPALPFAFMGRIRVDRASLFPRTMGVFRSQSAHANLAIPDLVAVMLQVEVAGFFLREARHILEFALHNQPVQWVAAQLVFHHLHPVEPVLGVTALDDQAHLVPFSDRFQPRVLRSNQRIERAGGGFRI